LDNILMDIRPVPAQPVPVAAAAAAQNTQEDVDLQARLQALSAI
jgi:hypothetical protein